MAFEVMLLPTNRVAVVGTRRNPFTGEDVAGGYEAVMNDAERDAVRTFLARHGAVLGEDLNVRLPNASISSTSLDPGGALVALRGDIAVWAQFLFELASAGNFAILPTNFGPVMTTAAAARDRMLSDDDHAEDEVIVVSSGAEVAKHLAEDYQSATDYIARVIPR